MAGMTRSRYRFFETEYPYFLTNTIVGWLPIFTRLKRSTSFMIPGDTVSDSAVY